MWDVRFASMCSYVQIVIGIKMQSSNTILFESKRHFQLNIALVFSPNLKKTKYQNTTF